MKRADLYNGTGFFFYLYKFAGNKGNRTEKCNRIKLVSRTEMYSKDIRLVLVVDITSNRFDARLLDLKKYKTIWVYEHFFLLRDKICYKKNVFSRLLGVVENLIATDNELDKIIWGVGIEIFH